MERAAKRQRIDLGEISNEAPYSPHHNHHELSNSHAGTGVSSQHSNFQIGRDFIIQAGNSSGSVSTSAREQLLESLRFDQIDARKWSIKKAHAQTCRWFPKTTLYKQWENNDIPSNGNRFLWIKGKPGARKSTLMKFLLKHIQNRIGRSNRTEILIWFFFNARGEDLEKSTVGLYRSLLLQVLEARPELQQVLDAVKPGRQWDLDLLKGLFEEAIQALDDISIVCLIDALDECEEAQIRNMVDFLNGLVNEGNRLQICFASRHYPEITMQTGLSITLENQHEHEIDIANYLSTELRIGGGQLAEKIRLILREKALGVFMWVVLVVDILNKEYDAGHKHTLLDRLQQIPSNLHDLFRDILTRDNKDGDGLLLCVQWILFARQPLTPKQLYFAIISGVESRSLVHCHSEEYLDDNIRRYVLNKSKGLAESTKSASPTVQFIHESVRDFLLKEVELGKVFPQLETNIIGKSHEALKQCCLTYMSIESLAELEGSPATINFEFPFLAYVNQGVLYHADQAESNCISQQDFLAEFPRSEWLKHYNAIQKHKTRQYTPMASLRYILAEAGMSTLIRVLTDDRSCFDVEDERYGLPILAATSAKNQDTTQVMLELEAQRFPYFPFEAFYRWFPACPKRLNASSRNFTFDKKAEVFPQLMHYGSEMICLFYFFTRRTDVTFVGKIGETLLHWASHNGHVDMAKVLISLRADVSAEASDGRTPLHWISKNEHVEVAKLLIDHGADVSAEASDGRTPLHWISKKGQVEVAKLLIDCGADVSAAAVDRWTPLHWALQYGHVEVAKLLIDQGADVSAAADDGSTPLHRASRNGHVEMVKLLIDHGADVSAPANHGFTPLDWASQNGHVEVTKLLIDCDTDVSTAANDGSTPLYGTSG